jgi:hypothetical protein
MQINLPYPLINLDKKAIEYQTG